jgi:hypothetical protein
MFQIIASKLVPHRPPPEDSTSLPALHLMLGGLGLEV